MRRLVVLAAVSAGCYPGVDNSDCKITCGLDGACPSNLSCSNGFCITEGQTCIAPDLAAAYSFDEFEVNGTIRDHSGNDNTLELFGDPVLGTGHTGMALELDGVDDYGDILDSASLEFDGSFTVSMWVFLIPDSDAVDDVIVGKLTPDGNPTYQWGVEFDDGGADELNLFVTDDNGGENGTFAMGGVVGRFVHVAYAYDGVDVTGYVDGVAQNIVQSRLDKAMPERHGNVRIGADGRPLQFLHGSIDDLRIYRRALTADEIARDMMLPVQ